MFEDLKRFKRLAPLHSFKSVPLPFLASQLGVSVRHLRRIIKQGKRSVRQPWNRLSEEVKKEIIGLKEERPNFNCQWISELVSDRFERAVSRPSVWRILKSAGLLQSPPLTRTPRSRFEAKASGDIVQMDTTWGYWLNGRRLNLILLLDDHSRYILAAEFFWEDSAYNNMLMIRKVVENYGAFRLLYTDNASFFKFISHQDSYYRNFTKSEYESEITKACRQLGITHITHKPYQPQGKGKIERIFRFIQERFISQFERQKVKNLDRANVLLWRWVDWYNERHINRTIGCEPKKRFSPKGFTPLPRSINLDDVFCFKDSRKVDKCNQFSVKGKIYTIPKEHCMVAFVVTLHIHPNRFIRVWHREEFLCELPFLTN